HAGHQHRCADWFDRKGRRCICRGTYERACGELPHSCQTGTNGDYVAILVGFTSAKASKPAVVHAADVFFDCGVAVSDAIPQQETDLVVSAENIVQELDNLLDEATDPDCLSPRCQFQPGGVFCDALNL